MTSLRTRIALGIIRRYPRRWRERYESEMRAIVEDHGVRARDLADLAFGALREHWRTPHGPDPGERPFLAALWRGLAAFSQRAVLVSAVGSCAYAIGWIVGFATGPLEDSVPALFGMALTWLAIWVALRAIHQAYQASWLPPEPSPSSFTASAQRIMAAGFLALLILLGVSHERPEWTMILQSAWLLSYPIFDRLLDPIGRQRRLDAASRRYFNAREHLKWARMELQRLVSLDTPSDSTALQKQRAEVARLQSEMAAAVEILRHPDRTEADPHTPAAS